MKQVERWRSYLLYAEKSISNQLILEKYNSYKDMLFQIAFSYLGNKYDCEDVTIGNGHLMIEFVGFDVSTTLMD
ncbi:MAG: hypothetical protein QM217_01545 [Bacillota bacterium]|jgi:hypothetical protein|nr:hypothetical protein [Bacillota bacterium]